MEALRTKGFLKKSYSSYTGFSGRIDFLKKAFNGKSPCSGVKISHNTTFKYATTTKAAWNVKFIGFNQFNDKNIIKSRENYG
jgi:hypothetical protein